MKERVRAAIIIGLIGVAVIYYALRIKAPIPETEQTESSVTYE